MTTVHHGSLTSIAAQASAGLVFLKAFLQALDSLSPATDSLEPFLKPGAVFVTNGGRPTSASEIHDMLSKRAQKLQSFRHDVSCAWDLTAPGAAGNHTVMVESVSTTIFKADVDPEAKALAVPEFSIIELEPMEGGVFGLGAVMIRTYMDPQPVMERLTELRNK